MKPLVHDQTAKQQLERDFSKFLKEKYSKGPNKTVVHLYNECIVCYITGFLTKAEEILVQSGCETNIYINRNCFIRLCKGEIEEICFRILNRKIKQFFPSYVLEENEGCWVIFFDNEVD